MEEKNLASLDPAFFTIVMGTGAFSIATLEMAQILPWLYVPALLLNYCNYLLFLVLAILAVISWGRNHKGIAANFSTPNGCALYSACGIALLVLGAQALRFGAGDWAAMILWSAGALLTLCLNFIIMLRFFLHPGLELTHFTPVFFVPVAGLVVIPVAGAQLSSFASGFGAILITTVCILALGGGIALYGSLFSLLMQRHLLASPIADQLAPTFWIHLAPAGWAGVSILAIAKQIIGPEFVPAAVLLALLLFGVTLWWLFMVILIGLRAAFKKKLSFNLAWWAFVFPTGSVAILSDRLDLVQTKFLFPFLWSLLALLWLLCAYKTVVSYYQKLFQMQRR